MSISVRKAVVIESHLLNKPWVPDIAHRDGADFLSLTNVDRDLARLLGLDMNLRAPLKDYTLFGYIEQQRDDAVDALIHEYVRQNDPMADSSQAPVGPVFKQRPSLFQAAAVPETLILDLPHFVTPDGERVPESKMKVITTPKRGVLAMIEATAGNLEWCQKAISVDWASKRIRRAPHILDDLPKLHSAVYRYRKVVSKLHIVCKYRKQTGVMTEHKHLIADQNDWPNDVELEYRVRVAEKAVMAFYERSHYPGSSDGSESSSTLALT